MKEQLQNLSKQLESANKKIELLTPRSKKPGEEGKAEDSSASSSQLMDLKKKLLESMNENEKLKKGIEEGNKELKNKDQAIEDLKKTLTVHIEKNVVKNTTVTESKELEVEKEMVRLISEKQLLREKLTVYERNFEAREAELLEEINRLANELALVVSQAGDPAPASFKKMVDNVKLQSELK